MTKPRSYSILSNLSLEIGSYSKTSSDEWTTIVPETIGERLFEASCPSLWKDVPLGKRRSPKSKKNIPRQGMASVNDIEANEINSKKVSVIPKSEASGKDDLGVDYAIITATHANLREDTDVNSQVITQIPKGDIVVLLIPDPIGDWYNVIHVKSNQEGWIHKSTILTYYTKNRKPNITIPSRATGSYENPSLEVRNDSGKMMSLKLGEKRYDFMPQESKTMTLTPGTYKFHASAPNVIPDFGEQYFEAGHTYTWKFYIVTVRR